MTTMRVPGEQVTGRIPKQRVDSIRTVLLSTLIPADE